MCTAGHMRSIKFFRMLCLLLHKYQSSLAKIPLILEAAEVAEGVFRKINGILVEIIAVAT